MEDCIFCKIIKGEIPATKIYETEKVVAFNDINPVAKIHVLVIPKKHITSLDTLNLENEDENILVECIKAIQEITKSLGIDKTGYRIVTNIGEDANQEVKHLHFHILGGQKLENK